jgi:hypothetical protein
MDSGSLISAIDVNELLVEAPNLVAWKIGVVSDMDGVAQFMYKGGPYSPQASAKLPAGEDRRPEKSLWECVKYEMRMFLCTEQPRYQPLWKRITDLENRNTSAVIGVIAAFLGQIVGAPATLLAGFVAVCLYGAAKLGKEAYCRYLSQPQDS